MAVKKIFHVSPIIDVEILATSLIQDVIARIDIGDDNTVEGFVQFFDSQGGWDDHLLTMLKEAGKPFTSRAQALTYLQSTPKEEVEALLKPVWNAFLKLLADLINKYWSPSETPTPLPTGEFHQTSEDLIQSLLSKTSGRVEGGKFVLTFG